jgi:DinB superfamily
MIQKSAGVFNEAVFAVLLVGSGSLVAQNAPPTMSGEVKQNYQRTKAVILRAAEKMPDEGYNFKATPDVRTYAQVIGHISEAQAMICGGIVGQPAKADTSKTAKADVIVELKKSFDVCDKAYDSINEANASQVGGAGFMGGTLAGRLYGNLIHDNEMYGTVVVYLRLKGIVPPSSEGRGGR